jgi:hypothetical protein
MPLLGPLQVDMGFAFPFIFVLFFIVFILVVIGIARSASSRRTIQRPLSETTRFAPPPPPDTVMVKCNYCGTQQTWRETCVQCGAPLQKPAMP